MPEEIIRRPKILFPTEFGPLSEKAINAAVFLERKLRAELILFHSIEPIGKSGLFSRSKNYPDQQEAAQKLEDFLYKVDPSNQYRTSTILKKGEHTKTIPDIAREENAHLIVFGVGEGPSGIRESMKGATVREIIHQAPCPVLTIRDSPERVGFSKILVILDIGSHYWEKLEQAIRYARNFDAELVFFSPIAVKGIDQHSLERRLEKSLEEAREKKIPASGEFREIDGPLDQGILAYATEKDVDLVLIMTDNEVDGQNLSARLWGTEADKLVYSSHLPVLTIRPKSMYKG